MKKMLINARQQEEFRIALIDEKKLYDLHIENPNYEQKKFNIYKGKIVHIEPSLNAAFIDYGYPKHGFLSIKEISNDFYFYKKLDINCKKLSIKELLKVNQEILVQVNKEERRNKGASLTTFINLTGTYIILMVNNSNIKGISKRIKDKDRLILKEIIKKLSIPENIGFIIRTAGAGKTLEELQLDLNLKLNHWEYIKKKSEESNSVCLIYEENNTIIKIFRDYLTPDIEEIIVDDINFLEETKKYIKNICIYEFFNKIKIYSKKIPLFSYFQIESQIESAFKRKIKLPSGGSITFDSTEALTAIDVNSFKFTKSQDIEETAFKTNLESVYEIAKQLRFRDLGGLIVIDFIDMKLKKNNIKIENKLKEEVYQDRSKIQIGSISEFGILELSRQRLNKSLNESNYNICIKCDGAGFIRNHKSLSLSILRLIEEESLKENIKEIHVIVPISIGTYLLNEKRYEINDIENRNFKKLRIVIVPNNKIKIPNYIILRIKNEEETSIISYLLPKIHENNSLNINYKKTKLNKFKFKKSIYNDFNKNNKEILKNNIIINTILKKIINLFYIFKNIKKYKFTFI